MGSVVDQLLVNGGGGEDCGSDGRHLDDDCRCDGPSRVLVLPSAGAESVVGLALIHSRVLVLPILRGGTALVSLLFFVFLSGCASKSHISTIRVFLFTNVRVMDSIRLHAARAFLELRRTKSFPERKKSHTTIVTNKS